ncbi:MAG: cysteine desulfurase, partial [Patescibacteria group bacterium]
SLKKGDVILLTELEHHANLVPWQVMSKKKGLKLRFIPVDNEGNLIIDEKLFNNAKIVSVSHVSNALGTLNDIKKIEKLTHKNNAYLILDAAQSIAHIKIDVKELNCDFIAFSGHKVFGPMGIGVLYGKNEFLESIEPFLYGGDMISEVSFQDSTWNDVPFKFEAGTQNIAGAVGLGKAIDYVNRVGINNIETYENELTNYLIKKLSGLEKIRIYKPKNISSIVSFNIKNIHAHDIAQLLNEHGICLRAGHHCCMPLMNKLGISGTVRVSLSIYNDENDVDILIEILKTIIKKFD